MAPDSFSTFKELLDEKFSHVDTKLNTIIEQNRRRDDEHVACLAHRNSDMEGVFDRLRGAELQVGTHDEKMKQHENEIKALKEKDILIQNDRAQWFQGWGQWIGAIIAAFTLCVLIYQTYERRVICPPESVVAKPRQTSLSGDRGDRGEKLELSSPHTSITKAARQPQP